MSFFCIGNINEVRNNYIGIILVIIMILVFIGVLTYRRTAELWILSQRRAGGDLYNSAHPVHHWEDLKTSRLFKITINFSKRRDTRYE